MKQKTAIAIRVLFVILVTGSFLTVSCASWDRAYHKYIMRGTILETSGNEVYLCIGSRDGAQVGQKLDVYKITRYLGERPGKGAFNPFGTFTKYKTGIVKITQIVDEHYARAVIISGTAQKDFIVELER